MPDQPSFGDSPSDSLDFVEGVMAIEASFADQLRGLTEVERHRVIQEIWKRMQSGEFGSGHDLDDEGLAALVRKLGPRNPRGQAGAAAQPEE